MKRKIFRILGYFLTGVLFLTGLLIFICPLLAGSMTDQAVTEKVESFYSAKENVSGQDDGEEDGQKTEQQKQNNELYEEMQKYNQSIAKNGQSGLVDAWSYEQSSIDLSGYGLYDAPVGVIRIPKMEEELPVYLGASGSNMSKGAAQLGQTSMPIFIRWPRGSATGFRSGPLRLRRTLRRSWVCSVRHSAATTWDAPLRLPSPT